MKKQRSKSIAQLCRRNLMLLAALLTLNSLAQADSGIVVMHQEAGPFVVTVFVAPNPPRVGPVDISVLAQDRADGRVALDGEVFIQLRKEGVMTVVGQATRDEAQNKLLYSALMNLPEAGQWGLEVTVKRGKSAANVLGQVWVERPRPLLLSYWRSLSLPWIVAALFAMSQWLKRRAASRRRSNHIATHVATCPAS